MAEPAVQLELDRRDKVDGARKVVLAQYKVG